MGIGDPYSAGSFLNRTTLSESPGNFSGLEAFGIGLSIAGILQQAVAGFYAAKGQQYQAKSQKLTLEFERDIANLNARAAEFEATSIMEAANREIGMSGLRYGQLRAASQTSQAARGIQAGVGSAAEELASIEWAKEVDALTINSNAVRAAAAARMRATMSRGQALLSGAGARGIGGQLGAERALPLISGYSSLLGGAGAVSSQWAEMEYRKRYFRRAGGF